MTTAVLVGNPRAGSRTLAAALEVAARLQDDTPQLVDLATLGTAVLDPEDVGVQALVDQVASADPATYDAWAARIRAVVESLVRTKTEVA